MSLTERAGVEACRPVGQDGHTVAAVAADLGVGWATIMAAVREYGKPLVNDPGRLEGVHTLGVDETAFSAATPTAGTVFGTVFATGIAAPNGRARLLDLVAAAEPCCPVGLPTATKAGGLASRRRPWTRSAGYGVDIGVVAQHPRPGAHEPDLAGLQRHPVGMAEPEHIDGAIPQ